MSPECGRYLRFCKFGRIPADSPLAPLAPACDREDEDDEAGKSDVAELWTLQRDKHWINHIPSNICAVVCFECNGHTTGESTHMCKHDIMQPIV